MKIQAVQVGTQNPQDNNRDVEIFRLRVSGPVDPNDAIMLRARELVLATNSPAMIESFDWAVQDGSFVSEE